MTRHRPASFGAALARSIGAAVVFAISIGGSAAGASPAASAQPADPNIEAWLDQPLPPEAPAAALIANGVTIWDDGRRQLLELSDAYVLLHPASGKAKPTETRARSDWPGHLAFEIAVPRGGPGRLEVGFEGQTCTDAGTCTESRFPFGFGGVGPPSEAPPSLLVEADLQPLETPLSPGEPIDLFVSLEPRAAWDLEMLGLPGRLIAIAQERGGRDVATAELAATGERGSTPAVNYSGQITIAEPGDVTLLIAIPGRGTEDQVLPAATTRIRIGDVSGTPSPRPAAPNAPAGPADGGIPWLPIGLAVLVVAAGVVIRRVFADL